MPTSQDCLDYGPPQGTWTRVYALFARWGFVALFLAAILPPPTPMSPFLLAAGALRYPLPGFLTVMTLVAVRTMEVS